MADVRGPSTLAPLAPAGSPPKYVALAQVLLQQIRRQQLRPGDRLGTEDELGRQHGASRFTVRHALSILANEGYISRERARGTFVRKAHAVHHAPVGQGTLLVVCSSEQASHANEDFAFATVLRAMERTLAREGFAVQILSLGEDEQQDIARLSHVVRAHQLRGIVTIGPCLDPYRHLVSGIPVVNSGYFYSSIRPLVGDDVRAVCRECTGYLLDRGHQRVAMMCGSGIDSKGFALFVEGYRDACERRGLPVVRQMLFHAYPGESLVELARSILDARPRATAIVAEDWRVCEAVLGVARERGLRIPRDLSLVGYGLNVLHLASPVPLTAYVPDSEGIGAAAAKLLVSVIHGQPAAAEPVLLPGRLIERESVAPPPEHEK